MPNLSHRIKSLKIEPQTLGPILNLKGCLLRKSNFKRIMSLLANNRSVRVLNLGHNGIGAGGIKEIIKLINNNSHIKEINLEHNHIDDKCLRLLIKSLKNNYAITSIKLRNNNISYKDRGLLLIIRKILKRNKGFLPRNIKSTKDIARLMTKSKIKCLFSKTNTSIAANNNDRVSNKNIYNNLQ